MPVDAPFARSMILGLSLMPLSPQLISEVIIVPTSQYHEAKNEKVRVKLSAELLAPMKHSQNTGSSHSLLATSQSWAHMDTWDTNMFRYTWAR